MFSWNYARAVGALIMMLGCGLLLGIAGGAPLGAVSPEVVRWFFAPTKIEKPIRAGIGLGIMNGALYGFSAVF